MKEFKILCLPTLTGDQHRGIAVMTVRFFLKVNVLCQCQLFIRHGARTLKCEFKRLYLAFSSLTSLQVTWEIPRSMTTKIPEANVEDVRVDLQSDWTKGRRKCKDHTQTFFQWMSAWIFSWQYKRISSQQERTIESIHFERKSTCWSNMFL